MENIPIQNITEGIIDNVSRIELGIRNRFQNFVLRIIFGDVGKAHGINVNKNSENIMSYGRFISQYIDNVENKEIRLLLTGEGVESKDQRPENERFAEATKILLPHLPRLNTQGESIAA